MVYGSGFWVWFCGLRWASCPRTCLFLCKYLVHCCSSVVSGGFWWSQVGSVYMWVRLRVQVWTRYRSSGPLGGKAPGFILYKIKKPLQNIKTVSCLVFLWWRQVCQGSKVRFMLRQVHVGPWCRVIIWRFGTGEWSSSGAVGSEDQEGPGGTRNRGGGTKTDQNRLLETMSR